MALWLQYMAPKREVAGLSLRRTPISELARSLYKCAALWMAVYGDSVAERLLELFMEGREYIPVPVISW